MKSQVLGERLLWLWLASDTALNVLLTIVEEGRKGQSLDRLGLFVHRTTFICSQEYLGDN
jgi:hypothetical protein